jgi:hypothetical protein
MVTIVLEDGDFSFYPDDISNTFIRNADNHVADNTGHITVNINL